MTADHIQSLFGGVGWLNMTIGRTAFPIFSFLLMTHLCDQKNVKKYLFRLGGFALLTQLLMLPFPEWDNNVLLTFLCAVIFLGALETMERKKEMSLMFQGYILGMLFLTLFPLILFADYNLPGFLFLVLMYVYIKKPDRISYTGVLLGGILLNFKSVPATLFTVLTLVLLMSVIRIQGGKRLIRWWGFYLYYPLHLLLIHSLKILWTGL